MCFLTFIECNRKTLYKESSMNNVKEIKDAQLIGRYVSANMGEETFEVTFSEDKTVLYSFQSWNCIYRQFTGSWEILNDGILITYLKERTKECDSINNSEFSKWNEMDSKYQVYWIIQEFNTHDWFIFNAKGTKAEYKLKYME